MCCTYCEYLKELRFENKSINIILWAFLYLQSIRPILRNPGGNFLPMRRKLSLETDLILEVKGHCGLTKHL